MTTSLSPANPSVTVDVEALVTHIRAIAGDTIGGLLVEVASLRAQRDALTRDLAERNRMIATFEQRPPDQS